MVKKVPKLVNLQVKQPYIRAIKQQISIWQDSVIVKI